MNRQFLEKKYKWFLSYEKMFSFMYNQIYVNLNDGDIIYRSLDWRKFIGWIARFMGEVVGSSIFLFIGGNVGRVALGREGSRIDIFGYLDMVRG